jgi:hypothetical protein
MPPSLDHLVSPYRLMASKREAFYRPSTAAGSVVADERQDKQCTEIACHLNRKLTWVERARAARTARVRSDLIMVNDSDRGVGCGCSASSSLVLSGGNGPPPWSSV